MKRFFVRLDNLAEEHVMRLATAMGSSPSEAIRTIVHRDRHLAAHMDAMAVQLEEYHRIAKNGDGQEVPKVTQKGHKH